MTEHFFFFIYTVPQWGLESDSRKEMTEINEVLQGLLGLPLIVLIDFDDDCDVVVAVQLID